MPGEGATFSAQSYFDAIVALGAVPVVTDLQGATAFAQLQAQFNALVGAGGGGGATLIANLFEADQFIFNSFGITPYPVGAFAFDQSFFPDGALLEITTYGRYGNLTGAPVVFNPIISLDLVGDLQMGPVEVGAGLAPDYERHFKIASVGGNIYVIGNNLLRTFPGAAAENQAQVLGGNGFPLGPRPVEPFVLSISFAEFFNTADPNVSAVLNQVQAKVFTP